MIHPFTGRATAIGIPDFSASALYSAAYQRRFRGRDRRAGDDPASEAISAKKN